MTDCTLAGGFLFAAGKALFGVAVLTALVILVCVLYLVSGWFTSRRK